MYIYIYIEREREKHVPCYHFLTYTVYKKLSVALIYIYIYIYTLNAIEVQQLKPCIHSYMLHLHTCMHTLFHDTFNSVMGTVPYLALVAVTRSGPYPCDQVSTKLWTILIHFLSFTYSSHPVLLTPHMLHFTYSSHPTCTLTHTHTYARARLYDRPGYARCNPTCNT
jgi:hypothetical protein